MRVRARKIILLAVAAAFAVASGVAPGPAQAGMHPHTTPVAAINPEYRDTGEAAHDSHHNGDEMGQAAARGFCHKDGQDSQQPNSPPQICCVASCSAAALIFASFALGTWRPNDDYGVVAPTRLTPALLTSADPPPR
jgi:hypothetical protein